MNKYFIILTLIFAVSCKRPDPKYVLKSEVGNAAILHWQDEEVQTKYKRVKKSDIDKKRALEKMRLKRRKRKGRFVKKNLWDF